MITRPFAKQLAVLGLSSLMVSTAFAGDWPWRRKATPIGPNSPEQIGRSLDAIEDKVLDDGVIVIKRPDVWGQDRMTIYRRDFEKNMKQVLDPTNPKKEYFSTILSGLIKRSDQAALDSQTAVAGVLTATAQDRSRRRAGASSSNSLILTTPDQISGSASATPATPGDVATLQQQQLGFSGGVNPTKDANPENTVRNPITEASNTLAITPTTAFSRFDDSAVALEPTIVLDEKKRWLDHLSELRRVNLGDDVADMAGYGLYLFRIPISIQPGELTVKGHGAIITSKIRPEFVPNFLHDTFRHFVIADVIDQLGPVVFELIRNGEAAKYNSEFRQPYTDLQKAFDRHNALNAKSSIGLTNVESKELNTLQANLPNLQKATVNHLASVRTGVRSYPIGPGEISKVFLLSNLYTIASDTLRSLNTTNPTESEVRAYLSHELEAAYDLFPQYESEVGKISKLVDGREYSKLPTQAYPALAALLEGNLKGRTDLILPALCWAIAVDAGLLDTKLKQDMLATQETNGFACPEALSQVFYASIPDPQAEQLFQGYVSARWPMVTFALDPVVDQQNLGDAYSQRRDLQLALALSFAAGRTSLSQLTTFSKRLELDAETIALNRTVTTFAHGTDTFGWRFYPRFQNEPEERNNIQTAFNLLYRGGPGRNYQIKNSKLEAGQRELTVAVVMPSFVQKVRFEVSGNWFPLHDPDQMRVHTARMIDQGRRIVELRESLAATVECGNYRPGDLERIATRIDQVEAMLPLQTQTVTVPFETTSAGFQLFTPGNRSLAPELIGYQGINSIPENQDCSVILLAKHLSIEETTIVVGGQKLSKKDDDSQFKIISRDVIRLKIPKEVTITTSSDKDINSKYVEVYLASPNGLSNRLMIPYGDQESTQPPPVKAPVAAEPGFTFAQVPLSIIMAPIAGAAEPEQPVVQVAYIDSRGVAPKSVRMKFLISPSEAVKGSIPEIALDDTFDVVDGVVTMSSAVVKSLLLKVRAAIVGSFDRTATPTVLKLNATFERDDSSQNPGLNTLDINLQ